LFFTVTGAFWYVTSMFSPRVTSGIFFMEGEYALSLFHDSNLLKCSASFKSQFVTFCYIAA
jgi:hypothetical protein